MRPTPETMVNWIAGGVIAGAAVWAGALLFAAPQDTGPDVNTLQALASRLEGRSGPDLRDREAGRRREADPDEPRFLRERIDYAALRRARRGTPVPISAPREQPRSLPATRSPERVEPEASASVESLALIGVTSADGKTVAWVANLDAEQQESGGVGDVVFGYRVKSIDDGTVVLARGNREFTLHLEEPEPPAEEEAPPVTSAAQTEPDDDLRARFADIRDRFLARGESRGRGRAPFAEIPNRNERNRDAASEDEENDRRTASAPGRDDRRNDRGNRDPREPAPFPGPFNPNFAGFGPNDTPPATGDGSNTAPAGDAAPAGSTPINPQTARRRALVSGGSTRSTRVNPQTQRRRGNTSQPAFGEAENPGRNPESPQRPAPGTNR